MIFTIKEMKIKKIFLFTVMLISTSLIALFVYDILNNVDAENIVNLNYQYNTAYNKPVLIRDVTGTSSNFNNTDANSTVVLNNYEGPAVSWLIPVIIITTLVVVGGAYGLMYYCTLGSTSTPNQGLELDYL